MLTSAAQLEGPVDDLSFCADTAESYAVDHRPRNRRADGHQDPSHRSPGRRSASSARSPRGTSRTRSTSPSSARRWRRATPSSSSPRRTPRGARPCSASSSPSTPTSRPACVNIVTSSDHGVGALLSKDPRVDMVSFTGSTATGRAVMADGAATLKKVFLELGGKSAFLVLDDADLAGACSMSAFTASMHAGQGCAITTRLVVPRARYDEAVEAAAAHNGLDQARRPERRRHHLRAGDLGAPAGPGAGLPGLGDRRGRHVRLRRRPSRRPRHRLLHRADRHRGPRQQRQGRA